MGKDRTPKVRARPPTPPPPERGAQSISVRHILCEKHSQLLAAIARLEKGEEFDKVARDVSIDKAGKGGNLGWKDKGTLDKDFEEAAYKLPVSTCKRPVWAGPVRSAFGYHCE